MFTKDYTLLVGLKYYIKLSTKLLSNKILSTYIDLRGTLDPRTPKVLSSIDPWTS
jgi:hypothetical protein